MVFADIHTHIIPGIDDGAKDEKASRAILEMLIKQGITDVCFSSHFYPQNKPMKEFLQKRADGYAKIKDICQELGIKPHLASEVAIAKNIFLYQDISELCIDGGEFLLTELPFDYADVSLVKDMILRLTVNFSVTPIIVHPERYVDFFNEDFLTEMAELGCYAQFDIDALTNRRIRKKLIKFIEGDLIQFVGSDCHDVTNRKPNFDLLDKFLDKETVGYLFNNNAQIFED